MMDLQNMFTAASGDSINATAGTYLTTQCIDLWAGNTAVPVPPLGGPEILDYGRGRPVELSLEVTVAFVGGTNVTFQLVNADSNGTAVGGLVTAQAGTYATLTSPTVVTQTAAIATAALVAGYNPRILGLPAGLTQRYLLLALVTTGTYTAGTVVGGLVYDDVSSMPTL